MPEDLIDFTTLAASVDAMRETLAAMVAGLVADGFTPEQARAIIAGAFAAQTKGGEPEDPQ